MHVADLKEPCRHLRARAPEEWKEFVTMFTAYTAEAMEAVIDADAAEIMTRKGFAQANIGWLKLFADLDNPAPPIPPKPLAPIPAATVP